MALVEVQRAQLDLSRSKVLVRRGFEQLAGFDNVPGHTVAVQQHQCQAVLGLGVAVLYAAVEPELGSVKVLLDTIPAQIHASDVARSFAGRLVQTCLERLDNATFLPEPLGDGVEVFPRYFEILVETALSFVVDAAKVERRLEVAFLRHEIQVLDNVFDGGIRVRARMRFDGVHAGA